MFTKRQSNPQTTQVAADPSESMVTRAIDLFRYSRTGADSSPRSRAKRVDPWLKADQELLAQSRSVAILSNVNQYHQYDQEALLLSFILLTVDFPTDKPLAAGAFRETVSELELLANGSGIASERACASVEARFRDLTDIFAVASSVMSKMDLATKLLCVEDLTETKGGKRSDASLKMFQKPNFADQTLMANLTELFADLRKRHSMTLFSKGMIALEANVHTYHLQSTVPVDKRADAYLRILLFPALARESLPEIFKSVEEAVKGNYGLLVYLFMILAFPDKSANYSESWKEIDQLIPYGVSENFWDFKNTFTKPSLPFPAFFEISERTQIDRFVSSRDDAWRVLTAVLDRKAAEPVRGKFVEKSATKGLPEAELTEID